MHKLITALVVFCAIDAIFNAVNHAAAETRLQRSRIDVLIALGNMPHTEEQERQRQLLLAMCGGAPRPYRWRVVILALIATVALAIGGHLL
jgi:hypothetical protein